MDTASLLWAVLFGSIGMGYLIYGRKQRSIVPFISGIGLIGFPYFVSNTVALVLIGAALVALPFFLKT
ncbi:MAG: hypothetical protein P8Y69_03790 [Gammaproteobacteria bacterium]|jgi:hypothetical protein